MFAVWHEEVNSKWNIGGSIENHAQVPCPRKQQTGDLVGYESIWTAAIADVFVPRGIIHGPQEGKDRRIDCSGQEGTSQQLKLEGS